MHKSRLSQPWSPTVASAARYIWAHPGCRHSEIASDLQLGQSQVSRAVHLLRNAGALEMEVRCDATNSLLDLYAARYIPRLAATQSYWYDLAPHYEQAKLLAGTGCSYALSGDGAADLLAPWRGPSLSIAYFEVTPDLESLGFVPASGKHDASMLVRSTSDHDLLLSATVVDGINVASPIHVAADLLNLGSKTRHEAACEILRRHTPKPIGRTPTR